MLLTVEKITKKFNGQPVIKAFDFTLEKGEIVTLVGKSGTGKTTLMRIINHLETVDAGEIRLGDITLCKTNRKVEVDYANKGTLRKYRNQIGMVFQNYQLFPNLTVLENCMEAPVAQKRESNQYLQKKAMELLEQVGLNEKANAMPNELSGGQQQRVAIARALMLNPSILCFDEPTSALDRESTIEIGKMIQKIAANGTGILIVTHDDEFAKDIGTRVVSSDEFLDNREIHEK